MHKLSDVPVYVLPTKSLATTFGRGCENGDIAVFSHDPKNPLKLEFYKPSDLREQKFLPKQEV